MKSIITRSRTRTRNVAMPPTLRYRSKSNSATRTSGTKISKKQRHGSRLLLRPWLEKLLDADSCPGVHWKNREKQVFCIAWRHASSHGFDQTRHGDLFSRWAQHTGKLAANNPGDHCKNKSTFRCALNSLKDCIQLTKDGDKRGEQAKRTYQFIDKSHPQYDKKRNRKTLKTKEQHVNYVRTEEADRNSMDLPDVDVSEESIMLSDSVSVKTDDMKGLFSGETVPFQSVNQQNSPSNRSPKPLLCESLEVSALSATQSDMFVKNIIRQTSSEEQEQVFMELNAEGPQTLEVVDPTDGSIETHQLTLGKNNSVLPDFSALGIQSDNTQKTVLLPIHNSGGSVFVKPDRPEILSLPTIDLNVSFLSQSYGQHSTQIYSESPSEENDDIETPMLLSQHNSGGNVFVKQVKLDIQPISTIDPNQISNSNNWDLFHDDISAHEFVEIGLSNALEENDTTVQSIQSNEDPDLGVLVEQLHGGISEQLSMPYNSHGCNEDIFSLNPC